MRRRHVTHSGRLVEAPMRVAAARQLLLTTSVRPTRLTQRPAARSPWCCSATPAETAGDGSMASDKPRFTPANFAVDKQEAFASLQLRTVADKARATAEAAPSLFHCAELLTSCPSLSPCPASFCAPGGRRACAAACEPAVVPVHGGCAAAGVGRLVQ